MPNRWSCLANNSSASFVNPEDLLCRYLHEGRNADGLDVSIITTRRPAMGKGIVGSLVLSLIVSAGTIASAEGGSKGKSLYERLGGKGAITAVVDSFVGKGGSDARINGYFASTDLIQLKTHLVNQICEASGGPC